MIPPTTGSTIADSTVMKTIDCMCDIINPLLDASIRPETTSNINHGQTLSIIITPREPLRFEILPPERSWELAPAASPDTGNLLTRIRLRRRSPELSHRAPYANCHSALPLPYPLASLAVESRCPKEPTGGAGAIGHHRVIAPELDRRIIDFRVSPEKLKQIFESPVKLI